MVEILLKSHDKETEIMPYKPFEIYIKSHWNDFDILRWEMFVFIETYSEKYFWHVSVPVSCVRWYMYINMYISLCDINNDEKGIFIADFKMHQLLIMMFSIPPKF